jgi:hypothetical protein
MDRTRRDVLTGAAAVVAAAAVPMPIGTALASVPATRRGCGHGKTETASVVQQHFGREMDARHLPLAWESTANTIEDVLSAGKDVLVVVDEYVPGESFGDRF